MSESNRFDSKTVRSFILYEYLQGKTLEEAFENFRRIVGDDVITLQDFAFWFMQFSSGNMNVDFDIKSEILEEGEKEEPHPSKIQKLEEPSLEIKSEHLEEIDESIEAPNTDIWSGMGPAVCVEQDKCDDHRCCLCGFFVRGGDGNRKSHVIARHSVAKHLKCKECDYRDKSKVPMRNHTISVHGRDITPEDITDDNMKAELMEIMAKCFPNIRPNKIKNISNCAACKLCDSRLKMPLVNRYEEVAELIKVVSASINFKRCSFELLEMPDVETLKGVLNLQQTGSPDVFSIPNSNLVIEFLPSDDKIQITKI